MNIHEAIDGLEYLIGHSRQVPLTRTVMIDQEEALQLIDNLRLALPDEIKQALAKNLCRCGSHLRIVRAVQRAASGERGQ